LQRFITALTSTKVAVLSWRYVAERIWTFARKITSFRFPKRFLYFRVKVELKLSKICLHTFQPNIHSGKCPGSVKEMGTAKILTRYTLRRNTPSLGKGNFL